MPSLQLAAVGHTPAPVVIAVSHVSGGVTTWSPHPAQSLSFAVVAPAGQQPSPFAGAVMVVCVHIAVHAVPASASVVQAAPSLHLAAVGHAPVPVAIAVSQVSPVSTMLLPHITEQSESVADVAPVGQQPSPGAAAVMLPCTQCVSQLVPATVSVVHAMPSSQLVGHAPVPVVIAVSHISAPVTAPSPHSTVHVAEQPSLGVVFRSSQVSLPSTMPFPQRMPPSRPPVSGVGPVSGSGPVSARGPVSVALS
jgi:hypothetical protein